MPTESFALAEASPSYTGVLESVKTTFAQGSKTVEFWRFAMEAGGWTPRAGLHAGVTVTVNVATLPLRSPEPAGGDADKLPGSELCAQRPAFSVFLPGGVRVDVWGWDPGKYTEPPCDHFAYGSTKQQTYDLFKAALAEAMGMLITRETRTGDIAEIRLTGTSSGPGSNGTRVEGMVSGTAWHGGYVCQSGTYRGKFISVGGAEGPGRFTGGAFGWEFTVRLHNGEFDIFGGPGQTFYVGLSPSGSAPRFRICVCPYQFAIWTDGETDQTGSVLPAPRSVLISMPWVPEGFTGHNSFVFGTNSTVDGFRRTFEWSGWSLRNGQWSGDRGSERRMIVPVMRSRISGYGPDRLTTTQGMLVSDNAYVTSRSDPDSSSIIQNRIAGKLWNCAVVHDNYPPETIYAEMTGGTWIHLSSQNWYRDYSTAPQNANTFGIQKVSLWWKVTSGDMFPPETA